MRRNGRWGLLLHSLNSRRGGLCSLILFTLFTYNCSVRLPPQCTQQGFPESADQRPGENPEASPAAPAPAPDGEPLVLTEAEGE